MSSCPVICPTCSAYLCSGTRAPVGVSISVISPQNLRYESKTADITPYACLIVYIFVYSAQTETKHRKKEWTRTHAHARPHIYLITPRLAESKLRIHCALGHSGAEAAHKHSTDCEEMHSLLCRDSNSAPIGHAHQMRHRFLAFWVMLFLIVSFIHLLFPLSRDFWCIILHYITL